MSERYSVRYVANVGAALFDGETRVMTLCGVHLDRAGRAADQAMAQKIALALNAHEDLVAALRAVDDAIEIDRSVRAVVKAALTKATA